LVSKPLRKLLEILQQTPINALIWLNIGTAITPKLARVNRIRPKFCELVGDFIKLNQRFKDAFAFTSLRVIALEPGVEAQAGRCANEEEWDDVLVPDEPMNFVCRCEIISLANIDNRDGRALIIEWTERIDTFKATCPPPRSRSKDMPNIRRTLKCCRASPEKIPGSAVAQRFD
jgi:hypothetical protein